RVENLPLQSFLTNPTKISNALRQIRAPLRSDAITCYFDPSLEVEASRATGPEEVLWRGRIPVVLDVIRRLKMMQREDFLLMVTVSGISTLSARLAGTNDAAAIALETTTQLCRAVAEAGANLVFLREDLSLSSDLLTATDRSSIYAP